MLLHLAIAIPLALICAALPAKEKGSSSDLAPHQWTDDPDEHWEHFKKHHNKQYPSKEEHDKRKEIFKKHHEEIRKHNELHEKGHRKFKTAMNHLGDWTKDEYQKLNGFVHQEVAADHSDDHHHHHGHHDHHHKHDDDKHHHRHHGDDKHHDRHHDDDKHHDRHHDDDKHHDQTTIAPNVSLPASIDWREKGYVTPVGSQGSCGDCYSFSFTGSLEGQHKRKTGKLVALSQQNIVDCSRKYGNHGCDGGTMYNAYKYVKGNGGLDTLESYPYKGVVDPCKYSPKNIGATVSGFQGLPSGSESALQEAVATIGPISVGIQASQNSFQFYHSGIYADPNCTHTRKHLDHAVLVVGYGNDPKHGDYWIIKNSWNTDWGMEGYMLLARNDNNMCGVASAACYPLV